jgi:hypothetical protein
MISAVRRLDPSFWLVMGFSGGCPVSSVPSVPSTVPLTNRRAAWIAAAVFTVMAIWMLRDGLGSGRVLIAHESLTRSAPWNKALEHPEAFNSYLVDQPRIYYPYLLEAARVYAGEADALWTSRGGAGQPFLGNITSSLLHPLTLLAAFIDLDWLPWLQGVLVLSLGAFFTWLFLRRLNLSIPAAAFGAVAFGFGGHQVLWLQYALSHTLLALPFTCWAVERLSSDPSRRRVAILAFGFALFVLGGHPETGFAAGLVAGLWALYRLWDSHGRMLVTGAVLLAVALSAVQWAPFLEYVRESHGLRLRELETSRLQSGGVSFASAIYAFLFITAVAILRASASRGFAKRMLAVAACALGIVMARRMGMAVSSGVIFLPELYGNPSGGAAFTAAQDFPGLNAAYVGVLPPLLLTLGFFVGMGHGFIRFFALVGLLLWGTAFHLPGVEGLVRLIPGLTEVAPTRLLGPVGFCTACGGAMVIDRLSARGVKPGVLFGVGRLAVTMVLALLVAFLVLLLPFKERDDVVAQTSGLRGPDPAIVHGGRTSVNICLDLEQPVDDLRILVDGDVLRSGMAAATLPGHPFREALLTYRMEEGRHRLRVEAVEDGEVRVIGDQSLQIGRRRQLSVRDLLMISLALGGLGWLVMKNRTHGSWVLAAIVTVDVMSLGSGYNVGSDVAELFPPTQTVEFLRAQKPPFRIFTEGTILPPDTQFVAGVDHLLSYDNLGFSRTHRWLQQVPIQMDAFASFSFSRTTADYASPRFDALDVRYILTDTDTDLSDIPGMQLAHESETNVWENTENRGRAYIVGRKMDLQSDDLERLLAADPGEVALFETAFHGELGGSGRVVSVDHRGSEIEVVTETTGNTILILAESKAMGWSVSIDGGPEQETRYVNLSWHGVPLSEGRHKVLFSYDPPSYRWGLRLSLAGALVWLLMLLFPRHLS